MKVKYIILIVIAIGVIGYLIYFLIQKNAEAKANLRTTEGEILKSQIEAIGSAEAVASGNCIPFTAEEYKDNRKALERGCASKLAIPFIGVGLYAKCVQDGLKNLPPIKTC